jgi:hypothetical protein
MNYMTTDMNIQQLQIQRKKAEKILMSQPETKFIQMDLSYESHPEWMTRVFKNNRYCIMIADNCPTSTGYAIRCMIQRWDNSVIPYHWRELQRIKNEIFGKEVIGIEYYPKESELVNEVNIYWLWIFPENMIPIPTITKIPRNAKRQKKRQLLLTFLLNLKVKKL